MMTDTPTSTITTTCCATPTRFWERASTPPPSRVSPLIPPEPTWPAAGTIQVSASGGPTTTGDWSERSTPRRGFFGAGTAATTTAAARSPRRSRRSPSFGASRGPPMGPTFARPTRWSRTSTWRPPCRGRDGPSAVPSRRPRGPSTWWGTSSRWWPAGIARICSTTTTTTMMTMMTITITTGKTNTTTMANRTTRPSWHWETSGDS
mmetsp:Transcript_6857/g.19857  ORF Transcript_6857/g.19857 Transcript_6857/m.19857 type:complete len:206 (+) Transcript_6857:143-760(+)